MLFRHGLTAETQRAQSAEGGSLFLFAERPKRNKSKPYGQLLEPFACLSHQKQLLAILLLGRIALYVCRRPTV
jgi:hypothetical protein